MEVQYDTYNLGGLHICFWVVVSLSAVWGRDSDVGEPLRVQGAG